MIYLVLAKEAVLNHEFLIKRTILLCSRFFLCENEAETINHLFLQCSITDQLWKIFINCRGIAWAMPSKITDTLLAGRKLELEQVSERWKIIPSCIWWTIWKERMLDVLRRGAIQYKRLSKIVLYYFAFGVLNCTLGIQNQS